MNNTVMTQPEKIKLILTKGAEYFGVSVEELTTQKKDRSHISPHKRMIIPLLFDNTNLNGTDIAKIMGYKDHVTAYHHYRGIRNELSEDVYGTAKTKKLYKELIQYIGI